MNLLSKKDLLMLTKISYGQLYRWKRQGLIPEEWFIKQPSYTGQETFFPKEQILSRIASIVKLKGEHSMEEMAAMFSTAMPENLVAPEALRAVKEIELKFVEFLRMEYGKDSYDIFDITLCAGISQMAKKINMSIEKAAKLFERGCRVLEGQKSPDMICTIFVAGKKYHIAFAQTVIVFDNSVEIVEQWKMEERMCKIKRKYQKLFAQQ